jgi:thiosulfate dehydrogenase [quinone] large subunit
MAREIERRPIEIDDPPVERFVFGDTRFAIVWLIARLYVGWSWLDAGMEKVVNPAWTQTGAALKGFWTGALAQSTGPHPAIAFDWYRSFIEYLVSVQAWTWFAKLIVAGELTVGVLLILGAFTGIAAFLGGFLNWNFMMAGSASINPILFTLSILLMLAWKNAGYLGLDRWLLPALGTPWKPAFRVRTVDRPQTFETPVER